jgi:hypothetical protein
MLSRSTRTLALAGMLVPATILLAFKANAQDATSYSYNYAAAGTIGAHEVFLLNTDLGPMQCKGGNNRVYTGRGYQPNDGIGRNVYRTPGERPTGSSGRRCYWLKRVLNKYSAPRAHLQRDNQGESPRQSG